MKECNIKYPLKFHPVLKQTLWGGERIVPFLSLERSGDDNEFADFKHIGECWAISGITGSESVVDGGSLDGRSLPELVKSFGAALVGKKNFERFGSEFPLLVKFIDAAQDLSVQVHPDDKLAAERHGCSGKTEMWYVVDAKEDAKLLSGFATPVTKEQYNEMSAAQIVDALQEYKISQGDMFYLPAGTIHSIGAGAFIAEIQQSSDITYRIYDFNRKDKDGKYRELHTSQAAEAIDFSQNKNCKIEYSFPLTNSSDAWNHSVKVVDCGHFITSLLRLDNINSESEKKLQFNYAALDSFVLITCTGGRCHLVYEGGDALEVSSGDAILLPCDLNSVEFVLKGGSSCELLETHI